MRDDLFNEVAADQDMTRATDVTSPAALPRRPTRSRARLSVLRVDARDHRAVRSLHPVPALRAGRHAQHAQRDQARIGPWHVRQVRNPGRPACVSRRCRPDQARQVTKDSVVRGHLAPALEARRGDQRPQPRVGLCYSCGGEIGPRRTCARIAIAPGAAGQSGHAGG